MFELLIWAVFVLQTTVYTAVGDLRVVQMLLIPITSLAELGGLILGDGAHFS